MRHLYLTHTYGVYVYVLLLLAFSSAAGCPVRIYKRAFLLLCFGENYSFPILIVQFFFIEKKLPPPPFCSTRFITELKCCCTNYLSERVLELSVKLFSPCNLAVWRLILQTGMWFLKGLYIYGHFLCHCDSPLP